MRPRTYWPALLLLPALAVIGIFAVTLFAMARYSVALNLGPGLIGSELVAENYERFLGSDFYMGFVWRSLKIAAYCTAITAVLGYVIAYFMFRSGPTLRVIAGTVLIVQFFTAYVIRTYAVMLVIGRNGLINTALLSTGLSDTALVLLFTETGVAIGMVMVSLPFMVFPILASLQSVPQNLEMAATSLGAGGLRTFWEVIFPLTLPGLAAGVVIVFLFEMTSYIVPGILGGGYVDMVANLIYAKAMGSFDYPFAAAAAMIMLVISGVAVYLLQRAFRLVMPRSA